MLINAKFDKIEHTKHQDESKKEDALKTTRLIEPGIIEAELFGK